MLKESGVMPSKFCGKMMLNLKLIAKYKDGIKIFSDVQRSLTLQTFWRKLLEDVSHQNNGKNKERKKPWEPANGGYNQGKQ